MRIFDREAVIAGYRDILGRDPESDEVIRHHVEMHSNQDEFARALIGSEEYRERGRATAAIITEETIDRFVAESDALGPPSSPQVQEFWIAKRYVPAAEIDETLDPFGEEYVAQQIALYEEMSGRSVDQEINEATAFQIEAHLGTANPYAHVAPGGVAVHMGRVARTLELANFGLGDRVIDLGCGWGATCEMLAFAGLEVVGVDIQPMFTRLVNERALRRGWNITARTGTFEAIPGDDQFDGALFYECLHHAIRPWAALRSVHGRLRSGGCLMLAGEPVNGVWKHWGLRTDPMSIYCIRKFGWFESGWSSSFLRECLDRCGFMIRHFENEGRSVGWVIVANKR